MVENIFQNISEQKERLKQYSNAAFSNGWISEETHKSIINKLDNDVLTLGVVGQIKAGKSTFLNSILFGQQVLPVADSPMTASLSIITYGDKKCISAEFYTKEEWDELVLLSSRVVDPEFDDESSISRIQSAKELVAKASLINENLDVLWGTNKEDTFDSLIDYVGAEGRYTPITKLVRIQYPVEWLKGVEIVDTPGLNDPVASREARTQEFLKNADAVILLLAANRAFDATDSAILFDKIQNVGIGKVIIAVNKYDLTYESGESIEQKTISVKNEINKECIKHRDSYISDMVRNLEPHLLAADMALLSQLPMETISSNKSLKFYWDRYCKIFGVSSQKELYEKSRVNALLENVKHVIGTSKNEILFKKPINLISQAGELAKNNLEKQIADNSLLLESLSVPDYELEDRLNGIKKVQRRMDRLISTSSDELEDQLNEEIEKARRTINRKIDAAKDDCDRIIDSEKKRNIARKCEDRIKRLLDRDLSYIQSDVEKSLRGIVKDYTDNFVSDSEEHLRRYLSDYDDLLEELKNAITHSLKSNENEMSDNAFEDQQDTNSGEGFNWLYVIPGINLILLYGDVINEITDWLTLRDRMHSSVNDIMDQISSGDNTAEFNRKKQQFLNSFNGEAVLRLIGFLTDELQLAVDNKDTKENKINELQITLEKQKHELATLNSQIQEMNAIKNSI